MVASNRSKTQVKDVQKLRQNSGLGVDVVKQIFHVNLLFRNIAFDG